MKLIHLPLIAVFAFLLGCGQPWDAELEREEPVAAADNAAPTAMGQGQSAETSDSDLFSAAHLGLRLVGPAAQDPAVPCQECVDQEITAQFTENEISIREMLHFDKTLFFTWPENAFPTKIRTAYFKHRVQNPMNQLLGPPDRFPVSFEAGTRVWFIPISKLARLMDHDPSFQQWLGLDLVLADGRRLEIQIRFRALGILPAMVTSQIATTLPGNAHEYAKRIGESKWLLRRESISNPANRPLRVWTRLQPVDLRLSTVLTFNRYQDQPRAAPVGPIPETYLSSASASSGALLVHRQGEDQRLIMVPGHWVPIDLAPAESVTLEWVTPMIGSTPCRVPPEVRRTAHWEWRSAVRCHRGECMGGEYYPRYQDVTETWGITGAAIVGSWGRDLRVANPFTPEDLATASEHLISEDEKVNQVRLLYSEGFRVREQVGTPISAARGEFACQGVFR